MTLTPLKRAFLALEEAEARLAAAQQAVREPIAIIGLGCRLPGGASNPAAFWELMRDGRDAVSRVPADRWDADAYFNPDPSVRGCVATREGGFIAEADTFDPAFFGIAPREARAMDPQQRLFLEVAWEALEHAGLAPDRLERSATGVYVGVCTSDYTYLQIQAQDHGLLDAHFTSGIAHSIVSGRLSYLLGLQGPSLTIDTACSSSLVAVHLACQALRAGDCRMALAGGVNLMLSPDLYVALSHSRMLAPDGRCKTFDAAADGFGRGEGCGVVVLKRLSDAVSDGDRILAVVRGSAVNQDGPSSGLTAPNGPAQEAVIREALNRAGVAPRQVGFIEAHGTGTQLGDPLEVQALGAVFGADRDANTPLVLGSVKTNIGHAEAAAGVAGLIKVVLALRNRQIPAHLHFRTPSPHIAWGDLPLHVPTALETWKTIDNRRIAGVSSFGFSGTNAHLVVEEAPADDAGANSVAGESAAVEPPAHLFTVSARDERAFHELVAHHAAALDSEPRPSLADVCFTANAGRAHFDYRATVIAHSTGELRERLAAGITPTKVAHRDPPSIAFLFTGQGAQYAGMARVLDDASPVFRQALDRCADLLGPHLPRPLRSVLAGDGLDDTTYTQPALFAVEYALAELLESWGITPRIVMGHSVGEYVAACRAGVLSLEDALRLIAARGRLMGSLPSGGGMAAVSAAEDRVVVALEAYAGRVAIGAVNGPEQTVISGDVAAIADICRQFESQGVRCHSLPVSHAFHSPMVEPILDAFEGEVRATPLAAPRLRLISNLTGALVDPREITQPIYWRRHVRDAVRFHDGLRTLLAMRPDCIVEIGPHPTLLALARTVAGDGGPRLVPTLRKGRHDWEQLLETLAALYTQGAEIEWRRVEAGSGRRVVVDLPTYPFQRERCWFDANPRARGAQRGRTEGHPLLGTRVRTAGTDTLFESNVSADAPGFLRDHRVLGRIVLPATGYLETVIAAASTLLGCPAGEVAVEDVIVKEAMLLDDEGPGRIVQSVIAPAGSDGSRTIALCSLPAGSSDDEPWVEHVTARFRRGPAVPATGPSLDVARERCPAVLSVAEHYSVMARRGVEFGESFKVVRQLWRGEADAVAEVELTAALTGEAGRYDVHPVLLDGCLQAMAALFSPDDDGLYLPIGIAGLRIVRPLGTRGWSHVSMPAGSGDTRRADIRVFTVDGALALELEGLQLKRVSRDALERLGDRWLDNALYQPGWRSMPLSDTVPVETLAAAGRQALPRLAAAAGMAAYDAFLPRLDARCQGYVQRALRELGWSADHTAAADPARFGVLPRHHRLFARLLEIAAEGGPVEEDGPLANVPPGADAELELTDRVARELAGALRGECDPMQLLFPGGSLATTERIYRDSPTAQVFGGLIAEIVAAAVAASTHGRRLRVLEVGAGTGGTTAHVLPVLAGVAVDYTFTDVGPLFVARARERFAAHPFVRYMTFDLERDATAQGLTAGDYDIVIASNVVHATADLRRTLERVHRLLAPAGLLVMLEVTAPQRWFDLTVGLTDGWWAFTDQELRANYPTLSRQRWLALLAEQGFEAAALPDGLHHGALALQSLFLARTQRPARSWWLVPDRGGVAASLCARLMARGDRCTVADALAPGETIDGVIYARALDGTEVAADALRVVQSVLGRTPVSRVWFVTRGGQEVSGAESVLQPRQATVWGFRRSVALEHPELRAVAIDLDPDTGGEVLDALLRELDAPGDEPEVALRADGRHVSRLGAIRRALSPPHRGPMRLVPQTRGLLDSLALEAFTPVPPGPGDVAIAVEATGLNFKDVLNVLGMYPGDPGPLGGECAGKVTAVGAGVTHVAPGDDVMAVAGGSFATQVVARAELVQPRPAGMSAEEGASIPIAFLTARFCLDHLAGLRAGDRVLIHAAAGGVGMAAVRLAQQAGAEIFATAGADWKRELLRTMGVSQVFDSRSGLFADRVLAATGGRGVDVVLNSLAGEMLDASFRVLAPGARFIEIGKRGIKEPASVAATRPDVAYHIVDWGVTAAEEPGLIGGMFARLGDEFRAGLLAPLPRHTFPIEHASRAFRFMAQARHAGKVVVRHGPPSLPAIRRDGTYVITGGLTGLGLVVARWLAERGAGQIVLVSRRGVTAESAAAVEAMRALGATVVAEALDATDEQALRTLLDRVRRHGPPLRGVIHSAGVLEDASVLQQDGTRFAHVLAPKVRGAELLDALTSGDALDHFVLFASVAGVLGSAGQSNHAAANAYLDVLARARRSRGLPGLSIDWGAWTDTGAAAGIVDRLAAQGIGAITPAQGLVALERLIATEHAQAMVLPVDWPRYLKGRPTPAFLSELAVAPKTAAPVAAAAKADLLTQLADLPAGRRRPTIAAFVREVALTSLGLDTSRAIDPRTPLGELGLDSLLAVELRNTIGSALGRTFPATLLFDYPTIDALTDFVLAELSGAGEEPGAPPGAPSSGTLVGAIEEMSDDEVERQLAARTARRNV